MSRTPTEVELELERRWYKPWEYPHRLRATAQQKIQVALSERPARIVMPPERDFWQELSEDFDFLRDQLHWQINVKCSYDHSNIKVMVREWNDYVKTWHYCVRHELYTVDFYRWLLRERNFRSPRLPLGSGQHAA